MGAFFALSCLCVLLLSEKLLSLFFICLNYQNASTIYEVHFVTQCSKLVLHVRFIKAWYCESQQSTMWFDNSSSFALRRLGWPQCFLICIGHITKEDFETIFHNKWVFTESQFHTVFNQYVTGIKSGNQQLFRQIKIPTFSEILPTTAENQCLLSHAAFS